MLESELIQKEAIEYDITDGEKIYFDCSACGMPLLEIWQTQPVDEVIWEARAECPFCPDHSFVKPIKSKTFHINYRDDKNGKALTALGDWEPKEIDGKTILVFKILIHKDRVDEYSTKK